MEKNEKKHTSEICGPSWWAMLHGAASGIKVGCSTCGEEADSLMRYAHDLVNVKHGKQIFAKRDAREWGAVALRLSQQLKSVTLQQDNCTPLPQGQATIDEAMEFARCQAINDLARYKWDRFGYHAANWVNMNKVRPTRVTRSPFAPLVEKARSMQRQLPLMQRKRGVRCPLDEETLRQIPGEAKRFLKEGQKAISSGRFGEFAKSVQNMCNTQQARFAQKEDVKISGKCTDQECSLTATAGGQSLKKRPRIKVPIKSLSSEGIADAVKEAREELFDQEIQEMGTVQPFKKPDQKKIDEIDELKYETFANVDSRKIELTFQFAKFDKVITSNDPETGEINVNYPGWLQPRDRSRAANMLQVHTMAGNLDPEMLTTDYHTLDRGAPVVMQTDGGRVNYVVSGNGRAMAIKLAADRNYSLEEYEKRVGEFLELPLEFVKNSMLVRVLDPSLSEEEIREIAELGNVSAAIATSTVEQAGIDSAKMSADFVSELTVLDGDQATIQETIRAPINRTWTSKFLSFVPPTEMAGLVDPQGSLNESGVRRIVMALTIWVVGTVEGPRLAELAFEAIDQDARNVINGFLRAIPSIASLHARMNQWMDEATPETIGKVSTVRSELTIGPVASNAILKFIEIKRSGQKVDEALQQTTMAGMGAEIHGAEEQLILMFETNKRSARRIAAFFNDYVEKMKAIANPNQRAMGFMGESTAPETLEETLKQLRTEDSMPAKVTMMGSIRQHKRLTAADRRKLPKSKFACPDQRAYPINDANHVRSALGRYRQEDTLKCTGGSKRICKAAKKFKIHSEVCAI